MRAYLVFLHTRRHKALLKAVKAMETKVNIQCTKLIHLENSMVIYWVYNTEALEKMINTIHQMHTITTANERSFTGELSTAYTWYVNKNGVHHYTINLLLYLRTLREKYVKIQGIHNADTHVCKGDKNSCKRLFTNLSFNTIKITRNFNSS